MTTTRTERGWVAGRVQGVFYRASLQRHATQLGLNGWVKNLPDGRVEFLAHGPADSVQALLDWAKRGPRLAHVVQFHAEAVDETAPPEFEIRH